VQEDEKLTINLILQNDKLTPLDCAQAYGHAEVVALIQGAGGQPYSYLSCIGEMNDKSPEEITVVEESDKANQLATKVVSSVEVKEPLLEKQVVFDDEIKPLPEKQDEEKKPLLEKQVAFDDEIKPLPEKQIALDEEKKPLLEKQVAFDDEKESTGQSISKDADHVKDSVVAVNEDYEDDQDAKLSPIDQPLDGEKVSREKETATAVPTDQDAPQSDVMQSPGRETTGKQKPLERPERFRSDGSLFSRAISFLRGQEQKPTTMVASAVALYGAQATFLAGAIMGSPLGRKAMEVGEKVAKNAADDLIDEASQLPKNLPALLWEESRTPTPLPTPTPPATPSPEPVKAPSPVVVDIDPLERRIRKARAQLDSKKTPAFLAIQELLKVQWCICSRDICIMTL